MKKRSVHRQIAVPAYNQPAEVSQPGNGSFHLPALSVAPQFPTVLRLRAFPVPPVRGDQLNAFAAQEVSQRVAVAGFVGNEPLRTLLRTSGAASRNGYRLKRSLDERGFCGRGRMKGASQRNTLAVDHHHPLRPLTPLRPADRRPPFFAGAKLPSAKASCQSRTPASSSSAKNVLHTRNHVPSSSHIFRRLLQVEGLGYRFGRSFQRAPLRSTHKMPSSTSRLSRHGRPRLLISGRRDFIFSHCRSVSKASRVMAFLHNPTIGNILLPLETYETASMTLPSSSKCPAECP